MSLDVYLEVTESVDKYWANITHNLAQMALKAGLFEALWRPEDAGWTHAEQLILPLERGLAALRADPEYFQQFNPSNGWSTYEALVRFTANYLAACREYPQATVRVSR